MKGYARKERNTDGLLRDDQLIGQGNRVDVLEPCISSIRRWLLSEYEVRTDEESGPIGNLYDISGRLRRARRLVSRNGADLDRDYQTPLHCPPRPSLTHVFELPVSTIRLSSRRVS